MSERKLRSFWPRVVATLFGVPLLYVASFGPACWWTSQRRPQSVNDYVRYRALYAFVPLIEIDDGFIKPQPEWLSWWMRCGVPKGNVLVLPIGFGGSWKVIE